MLLILSIPLCTFAQGPGLLHKNVTLTAGNITVEQALRQTGRQYNVPFSYVKDIFLPNLFSYGNIKGR